MKTKFCLLIPIAILLYCCQQKDWAGSDENDIETDSVTISGINNKMLRKWYVLNKESDSMMTSAQLIIRKQKEEVDSYPPDEREYMMTSVTEAQQHLDQLKKKVKYMREFASHIENYNPALQHTIDSLKDDYVQEQFKLEEALKQLR
ncbi:hypothetical protein D3C85_1286890 [compost metagenome]